MFLQSTHIRFPLWQFLRQPIFQRACPTVLNPQKFWHLYQVQLLERCLTIAIAPKDIHRD